MAPINKKDRDRVIDKARRCLAWAHDKERPAVPGADAMTNDQVRARIMIMAVRVMHAWRCVDLYNK